MLHSSENQKNDGGDLFDFEEIDGDRKSGSDINNSKQSLNNNKAYRHNNGSSITSDSESLCA